MHAYMHTCIHAYMDIHAYIHPTGIHMSYAYIHNVYVHMSCKCLCLCSCISLFVRTFAAIVIFSCVFHVCVYIHIHIYVYVYVRICTYMYLCVPRTHIHVCLHIYIYIYCVYTEGCISISIKRSGEIVSRYSHQLRRRPSTPATRGSRASTRSP